VGPKPASAKIKEIRMQKGEKKREREPLVWVGGGRFLVGRLQSAGKEENPGEVPELSDQTSLSGSQEAPKKNTNSWKK